MAEKKKKKKPSNLQVEKEFVLNNFLRICLDI